MRSASRSKAPDHIENTMAVMGVVVLSPLVQKMEHFDGIVVRATDLFSPSRFCGSAPLPAKKSVRGYLGRVYAACIPHIRQANGDSTHPCPLNH